MIHSDKALEDTVFHVGRKPCASVMNTKGDRSSILAKADSNRAGRMTKCVFDDIADHFSEADGFATHIERLIGHIKADGLLQIEITAFSAQSSDCFLCNLP
ncbi:hypothetical protein D3C80_1613850 [compost metagenome]